MPYRLLIRASAEKEMDSLPRSIHTRISRRIIALEDDPRPMGSKKLEGVEGYRLRIGDYRVVYTVDDKQKVVTIARVAHRREVYR